MNASYLSRLELGQRTQVGPDIYRRILAALGLDPDDDDDWGTLQQAEDGTGGRR